MTTPMEIRSSGHLLFILTPQGKVECFRDGWLHIVDIPATLLAGTPCITRRYVGKNGERAHSNTDDVLTIIDTCATITHSN